MTAFTHAHTRTSSCILDYYFDLARTHTYYNDMTRKYIYYTYKLHLLFLPFCNQIFRHRFCSHVYVCVYVCVCERTTFSHANIKPYTNSILYYVYDFAFVLFSFIPSPSWLISICGHIEKSISTYMYRAHLPLSLISMLQM